MQRYQNAYWIKEKVFRMIRGSVIERMKTHPEDAARLQKYLADYVRAYYTGRIDTVLELIAKSPL